MTRGLIHCNIGIAMLGLRTTIYKVPSLETAKAWYQKAFGTDPYFDEPFYVGFNIGGYELGLLPEEGEIPRGENVMSYWGVTDIVLKYEHLLDLGAKVHESPHNVGGDIKVCSVYDPWNNIIGLIYNPHFSLDSDD